jgi:hypothetical protein
MRRAFREAGLVNPLVVVGNGQEAIAYLHGEGAYADRLAASPALRGQVVAECGVRSAEWGIGESQIPPHPTLSPRRGGCTK